MSMAPLGIAIGIAKTGRLTTEQRIEVRAALFGAKLRRTGFTDDNGSGSYSEMWEKPGVTVTIEWEEKACPS